MKVVGHGHWCADLYEKHAAEVILYGRALGLSHAEAEDVLHDTFASLMSHPGVPERPLNYCLRCFRNRALNYRRRLWRRFRRELESVRWFEVSATMDRAEHIAIECLQRLPLEQREVIVLKVWHQYTYDEIGELLAISPNTVAGRYRYGMQKLKACLKGADYEQLESTGSSVTVLETAPPVAEA